MITLFLQRLHNYPFNLADITVAKCVKIREKGCDKSIVTAFINTTNKFYIKKKNKNFEYFLSKKIKIPINTNHKLPTCLPWIQKNQQLVILLPWVHSRDKDNGDIPQVSPTRARKREAAGKCWESGKTRGGRSRLQSLSSGSGRRQMVF